MLQPFVTLAEALSYNIINLKACYEKGLLFIIKGCVMLTNSLAHEKTTLATSCSGIFREAVRQPRKSRQEAGNRRSHYFPFALCQLSWNRCQRIAHQCGAFDHKYCTARFNRNYKRQKVSDRHAGNGLQ